MSASDKIYIQEGAILRTEKTYDNDVCYIRKEVLLEWAKETYLNEKASAIRKVCYKQLIDKLNEI